MLIIVCVISNRRHTPSTGEQQSITILLYSRLKFHITSKIIMISYEHKIINILVKLDYFITCYCKFFLLLRYNKTIFIFALTSYCFKLNTWSSFLLIWAFSLLFWGEHRVRQWPSFWTLTCHCELSLYQIQVGLSLTSNITSRPCQRHLTTKYTLLLTFDLAVLTFDLTCWPSPSPRLCPWVSGSSPGHTCIRGDPGRSVQWSWPRLPPPQWSASRTCPSSTTNKQS